MDDQTEADHGEIKGKTDVSIARYENGTQSLLLNVNQPIEPLKDDLPGPPPAERPALAPQHKAKGK